MKFSDLCKAVYPAYKRKLTSQFSFVKELFSAAGDGSVGESNAKQLFSGSKKFGKTQKAYFRGKDNFGPLVKFFLTYVTDVSLLILRLGIPEKSTPDSQAISIALAQQMKLLIDSEEEEVDNILISQYQQAKIQGVSLVDEYVKPLYCGDDVAVFHNHIHEIQSYEKIQHTWELVNSGSIVWKERKLIYKRGAKDRPEANPNTIEIPEVKPGNSIKITTTINGRGFDGVTHCIWEMIDSDGENCFPGRNTLFSVTIDAKFKR